MVVVRPVRFGLTLTSCWVLACASLESGGSESEGSTGAQTSASPSSGSPSASSASSTASGGNPSGGAADDSDGTGDETGEPDPTGGEDPPPPPPSTGMPAGIPAPTWGHDFDSRRQPSIWVDNTHPNCDDTQGTVEAPWCDPFGGTTSPTFPAGAVIGISGGPYRMVADVQLTFEGTAEDPVVFRGLGENPVVFDAQGDRVDFTYLGTYGVVENIDFFHGTRHRVDSEADSLVFRGIEVHNPQGAFIDFNPVFNVNGQNIVIHRSKIYDNRRSSDADSHGIQAGAGSAHLWILDNELYNNNGDSFQGCHDCFDAPPHHVYIGRNMLHEDRENAVDLKVIRDVVVSENVMYGYAGSDTSNGDAMVVGSNGYDDQTGEGPRNVWVLNNLFRDSATGIRIEGVQDVWVIGNEFHDLSTGIQIDDKQYRDIVIAGNTIDEVEDAFNSWNDSCSAQRVAVLNNSITNVGGRHLDLPDCDNLELLNNLLWNPGGVIAARLGGPALTDAAGVNQHPAAAANLVADPLYMPGSRQPSAGAPPVDAGLDLAPFFAEVEVAYGGDASFDRAFADRPQGEGSDIGAYER